MKEEIVRLLNDVALELLKHENEDATNLLDRIDRVLRPVHASMTTGLLQVSDFIPEFIDKLREQLESDHNRWGNTWLNRPKKGQELRTKARYTDYFDMFEQAGTPVPWMKVIGGALICWIRDQHPELFVDANECKPEIEGVKISEEGVEDIKIRSVDDPNSSAGVIAPFTYSGDEKPVEDMTTKELIESGPGVQAVIDTREELKKVLKEMSKEVEEMNGFSRSTLNKFIQLNDKVEQHLGSSIRKLSAHKPGCSVINNPPRGFASSVSDCNCQDSDLPDITDVMSKESPVAPIAHVCNERIENVGQGVLGYSPKSAADGRIILESIKFTNGPSPEAPVLGRCDKVGLILPTSKTLGILGRVSSNGQYRLTALKGVGTLDTIYVSYDYEYTLPRE